jgi:hypothetical protein
MKHFIFAALAVVSFGCAGGWGGYGYGQSPSYLPPAAYGPSMGAMGYGGGYGYGGYVMPPSPPDLAFVNGNGFPGTWRGTPHDVRVVNNTDFYVRIRLDGVDMAVAEQYVSLPPLIPPGQEAHFYAPLTQTDLRSGCEHHYLDFESYLAPNFQQPVQRTGEDYVFCVGWDHQTVRLGGF